MGTFIFSCVGTQVYYRVPTDDLQEDLQQESVPPDCQMKVSYMDRSASGHIHVSPDARIAV